MWVEEVAAVEMRNSTENGLGCIIWEGPGGWHSGVAGNSGVREDGRLPGRVRDPGTAAKWGFLALCRKEFRNEL